MKKISGLNQRVTTLVPPMPEVPGGPPAKTPTFKEVALNTIANYRPKKESDNRPEDRLKITNLGLIFLTATDNLEMEDDYYELTKKILSNSNGYSEFILGQWSKKFNELELKDLNEKGKKEKK